MSDDFKFVTKVDTAAITALEAVLAKLNVTIDETNAKIQTINEKGKGTKVVFQQMSQTGNMLEVVVKKTKNGWVEQKTAIGDNQAQLQKLIGQYSRALAEQEKMAKSAQRLADVQYLVKEAMSGFNPKTPVEVEQYNRLAHALTKVMEGSKLSSSELLNLMTTMSHGKVAIHELSTAQQGVANSLMATQKALQNMAGMDYRGVFSQAITHIGIGTSNKDIAGLSAMERDIEKLARNAGVKFEQLQQIIGNSLSGLRYTRTGVESWDLLTEAVARYSQKVRDTQSNKVDLTPQVTNIFDKAFQGQKLDSGTQSRLLSLVEQVNKAGQRAGITAEAFEHMWNQIAKVPPGQKLIFRDEDLANLGAKLLKVKQTIEELTPKTNYKDMIKGFTDEFGKNLGANQSATVMRLTENLNSLAQQAGVSKAALAALWQDAKTQQLPLVSATPELSGLNAAITRLAEFRKASIAITTEMPKIFGKVFNDFGANIEPSKVFQNVNTLFSSFGKSGVDLAVFEKLYTDISKTGKAAESSEPAVMRLSAAILKVVEAQKKSNEIQIDRTKFNYSDTLKNMSAMFKGDLSHGQQATIVQMNHSIRELAIEAGKSPEKLLSLVEGMAKSGRQALVTAEDTTALTVALHRYLETVKQFNAQNAAAPKPVDYTGSMSAMYAGFTGQQSHLDKAKALESVQRIATYASKIEGMTDAKLTNLVNGIKNTGQVAIDTEPKVMKLQAAILRLMDAQNKNQSVKTQGAMNQYSALDTFAKGFGKEMGDTQFAQAQKLLQTIGRLANAAGVSDQELRKMFTSIQKGETGVSSANDKIAKLNAALFQLNSLQKASQGKGFFAELMGIVTPSQLTALNLFQSGIQQIQRHFLMASEDALKLRIKIAQIETISQEATNRTALWKAELKGLSNAFAIDQLDVAQSAYNALSNQVTDAAHSIFFLADALNFARVAVATNNDAVSLASSVLNSYRQESMTAARSNAVLFKTIELGRVLANDMANTLGNVTTSAQLLSVSLEEVGASYVVLTRQGIKYNNATTLINNVLLKMLKPTEEMNALFKEWGVESGEAAIQTFGFYGVLKKLNDEAQEHGSKRIGELFSRERGVRGVSGLTQDMEILTESFLKMGAVARNEAELRKNVHALFETYDKSKDITKDNSGFRTQQTFNKMKNELRDVGMHLLEMFDDLNKKAGGVFELTQLFHGLASGIGGAAEVGAGAIQVFDAVFNVFGDGQSKIDKANKSLAFFSGTFIGAFAGGKIGSLAGGQGALLGSIFGGLIGGLSAVNKEATRQANARSAEYTTNFILNHQDALDKYKRILEEEAFVRQHIEEAKARFVQQSLTKQLAEQDKFIDQFTQKQHEIIAILGEGLNPEFAKLLPKDEMTPDKALDTLLENIKKSVEVIKGLKSKDEDNFIEEMIGLDEGTIQKALQNVDKLSEEMKKAFATDQFDLARDNFEHINNIFEKLSKAKVFENAKKDLEKSKELIEDIKRLSEDDVFSAKLSGMSGMAKGNAIRGEIERLRKEAFSTDDIEKQRKLFEQIEKLAKDMASDEGGFIKDAAKVGIKAEVDTTLLEQNTADRIAAEEEFQKKQEALVAKAQEFENLKAQHQADYILQEQKVQEELQKNFVLQKQIFEATEQRKKSVRELVTLMEELREAEQAVNKASQDNAENRIKNEADLAANFDLLFAKNRNFDDKAAQTQFEALQEEWANVSKLMNDKNANLEERALAFKLFLHDFKALETGKMQVGVDTPVIPGSETTLSNTMDKIKEQMGEFQKALTKDLQLYGQSELLKKQIEEKDKILAQLTGEKGAWEGVDLAAKEHHDNLIPQMNEQIKKFQEANLALAEMRARWAAMQGLAAPAPPGAFPARAAGGMVFGRDNQMVRVSGDEMIINARSTARFRAQLNSINAGYAPAFANGGQPGQTNVTFGDIHVHGQDNPQVAGREIVNIIRRELRRGN